MFALRLLWRDWRGGELGILTAALVVAVAIVTGIALFADRLQQGIEAQSGDFLAADRVLKSPRPVDSQWLQQASRINLQRAEVVSFQSMVYASERADSAMQLTAVKAVSPSYPLRGLLEVSDQAFGVTTKTEQGPRQGEVWLDSRLLPLLDIDLGASIYVGDARLTVTKVIVNEPDRGSAFSGFGPRVLMSTDDLAATAIIQPGSRVEYRYLFSGEAHTLTEYGRWLTPRMQPSHKWLDLEDSQPRIAKSLERAEQFLLLAGAMGVGLAGVAIALAARRYSERHYDYVAMMKALGATSDRIMRLYIGNLLVLAAASTLLGCAIGALIQEAFIALLQDYFDVAIVPAIGFRPFLIGIVTAIVCLLAFALPPLWNLQAASPLRVLRRDVQTSGVSAAASHIIGVAGIALLMFWYSGNWRLTLAVLAGIGVTFVTVGTIAWYLLRGSAAVGMQAGSAWRLALASMRRRGFENAIQAVIFSLSIMLLLVLTLLRSSLIEEWKVQLPEGTPNHFLINVSETEVAAVRRLLDENQLISEPIYPMVRGRLVSINGENPGERLLQQNPDSTGSELDRELNMTWSETVPSGNALVAGNWWQPQSTAPELSIEQRLAERLAVSLGDTLVFTIGSEKIAVTVSSIRSLDWDTMKPNFYMVMPPKLLQQFPATYITSFYLPQEKKRFLNQFLRQFPTITVVEMDAVIKQVRTIIEQVSSAVELVLGLIIISGLLVLIASVQASLDSRFQESAILRTLGAKRQLVLGSLAIEFAALGLLAGLMAAASAELAVYGLQVYVLQMDYVSHPWIWVAGPVVGALMIGCVGYLSCRMVVNKPPVEILRAL